MFTIQYTKDNGDMTVAMAILPLAHKKTHNPALTVWFYLGGKKEEYPKPCAKWRGVSYGKIGLTTVAVTHYLLSGMPLVL